MATRPKKGHAPVGRPPVGPSGVSIPSPTTVRLMIADNTPGFDIEDGVLVLHSAGSRKAMIEVIVHDVTDSEEEA